MGLLSRLRGRKREPAVDQTGETVPAEPAVSEAEDDEERRKSGGRGVFVAGAPIPVGSEGGGPETAEASPPAGTESETGDSLRELREQDYVPHEGAGATGASYDESLRDLREGDYAQDEGVGATGASGDSLRELRDQDYAQHEGAGATGASYDESLRDLREHDYQSAVEAKASAPPTAGSVETQATPPAAQPTSPSPAEPASSAEGSVGGQATAAPGTEPAPPAAIEGSAEPNAAGFESPEGQLRDELPAPDAEADDESSTLLDLEGDAEAPEEPEPGDLDEVLPLEEVEDAADKLDL